MGSVRSTTLLLMAISFPSHVSAQNLVKLSAHAAFEAFNKIDIEELWNSTSPTFSKGETSIIAARLFDEESRPRLDKWTGCGWLLIGNGDVGVQPVGLKVWTDIPCNTMTVTVKKVESKKDAPEIFVVDIGSSESVKISVSPDSRVFVGENEIGSIK